MPRSHALILIALLCSYIVAAALDGGTQVISFILNFAVFGASGTAHNFPEWWGNGTSAFLLVRQRISLIACLFLALSHRTDFSLSADRCALPEN